ncbi:MAG TPA: DUF4271 domain-containing protein [Puia sp.]|nr:DUF4271 domain-containing protein [Puia sp.]
MKSFILLTSLLVCMRLQAQTDTTQPPPGVAPATVQDTAIHTAPHPIRTMTHRDSVRRDSIRRVRRDSIARIRRDSMAKLAADTAIRTAPDNPASAITLRADSARRQDSTRVRDSLALRAVANHPPPVADTGPPVEIHQSNSKDSLFYLIVAILFYFAAIRIFFEKYFNNLMTLFFRVSLRQQQIREQVLQTPLPSLLLNILFVISAGLYACFLLHYSQWGAGVNFWILYLNCMGLLAAIYLVKFVVLKFIGWVFSISRATDIYIFIVFLVNKMLGIFLLPFLIVIIFSEQVWREVFITISLAMIFVFWAYRILASYRPIRNEIKLTPFYFFLYLCAFEVAPLLLIYKVLLTYLEKVY